jgi:hypothetical protein
LEIYGAPLRPKVSIPINPQKASNYVKAFPREVRHVGNFIVSNIVHIPHQTFELKLMQSFFRSLKVTGSQVLVLGVEKEKSNWWVSRLVHQNMLKDPPKDITSRIEFSHDLDRAKEFAKIHPNGTIILPDDAMYSGSQMQELIQDTQIIFGRKDYRTLVVTPFVTQNSLQLIRETGNNIEIFHSGIMLTVQDILLNKKEEKQMAPIFDQLFKSFNWRQTTLTYFDHKIPDFVSSLSVLEKNARANKKGVPVIQGAVPNLDGTFKTTVRYIDIPQKTYE